MLCIIQEENLASHAPACQEPIEYISKATTRLEQLVEGVLELARVSSSEKTLERVEMRDVLSDIASDYKRQFQDTTALLEIAAELPAVLGSRTHLYQIFGNLVGNALKYRSPERPLVVTITPQLTASRRKAGFTVTDTGRGIPSDKVALIFKPFNRAGEDTIEGTGVGLACVKKLIEKSGGAITVESVEGVGTTFTIELRRAPDE
jgi:signal transduction histidine kinase